SVADAPDEMWARIDWALREGLRGLPGNSSLARLLERERGVRNDKNLPPLTEEQILLWVDAHYNCVGEWPTTDSGSIDDAPGETWSSIKSSLIRGRRSLPGGRSLAQLLADERGVRNVQNLLPLTKEQILDWVDAHKESQGSWPKRESGPVHDAPGETWKNIDAALHQGCRALPGGSSLAQLLGEHRGVRNPADLPPLTKDQILAWA